ncbi:MAG TPA: AzlC family ABC transporter permease [Candidatus Polarisedimenticolaceae bacterium]|nr:AzlC family ABC transporter permease [Candidatus Polarisedimenticolaceae bacterium]
MRFAFRFRQGMKAAIPIWIAFVPSSIAWGIAAQAHGMRFAEIVLMSAWVYSGPAQFAVLAPLAEGKSALQVLVAGFLMNLRFLPMSAALAPYFHGVNRLPLLLSSHVVSASSFIVPYLQFQKERQADGDAVFTETTGGYGNLAFFLGVGASSFLVWVIGSGFGYAVALGFPAGFEEALKFILPGYFAGLLAAEMRGWSMPVVCLAALLSAVPGALVSPGWGWLVTASLVAILVWGAEQWKCRASALS